MWISLFHKVVLLYSENSIFISLKDGWFLHGSLISGHLLFSQFCGAASCRQSKILENIKHCSKKLDISVKHKWLKVYFINISWPFAKINIIIHGEILKKLIFSVFVLYSHFLTVKILGNIFIQKKINKIIFYTLGKTSVQVVL